MLWKVLWRNRHFKALLGLYLMWKLSPLLFKTFLHFALVYYLSRSRESLDILHVSFLQLLFLYFFVNNSFFFCYIIVQRFKRDKDIREARKELERWVFQSKLLTCFHVSINFVFFFTLINVLIFSIPLTFLSFFLFYILTEFSYFLFFYEPES